MNDIFPVLNLLGDDEMIVGVICNILITKKR